MGINGLTGSVGGNHQSWPGDTAFSMDAIGGRGATIRNAMAPESNIAVFQPGDFPFANENGWEPGSTILQAQPHPVAVGPTGPGSGIRYAWGRGRWRNYVSGWLRKLDERYDSVTEARRAGTITGPGRDIAVAMDLFMKRIHLRAAESHIAKMLADANAAPRGAPHAGAVSGRAAGGSSIGPWVVEPFFRAFVACALNITEMLDGIIEFVFAPRLGFDDVSAAEATRDAAVEAARLADAAFQGRGGDR